MSSRSYQAIGTICLIKQKDKKIAQELLADYSRFKSVYYAGNISGQLRTPNVQWLAGEKNTLAKVKENNCEILVDISKVMFSRGNQEEKRRIVSQIKGKEDILDMFAGIGYFTIPIAKLTDAHVWAIELNPDAIELLKHNIKLNKIQDKVKIICGDSKIEALSLNKKFDRIHMGYFPGTYSFLPTALKVTKKGAIIHFHELAEDSQEIIDKIKKIEPAIVIQKTTKVKKYGRKTWHWAIDLQKK